VRKLVKRYGVAGILDKSLLAGDIEEKVEDSNKIPLLIN